MSLDFITSNGAQMAGHQIQDVSERNAAIELTGCYQAGHQACDRMKPDIISKPHIRPRDGIRQEQRFEIIIAAGYAVVLRAV